MNTNKRSYRSLRFLIPLVIIVAVLLSGCADPSSSLSSSSLSQQSKPGSESMTSHPAEPPPSDSEKISTSTSSNNANSKLILTPITVQTPANEMSDSDLLTLFNTLYQSGLDAYNWPVGLGGIKYNENETVLEPNKDPWREAISGPDKVPWAKVTNIPSLTDLRLNYEVVFSQSLLNQNVYPYYVEGENPVFKDIGGELYLRLDEGASLGATGEPGAYPDVTKTKVISKTADSFSIETPMNESIYNELALTFTHVVVAQNEHWVFDTFYLITPMV